MKHLLIFLCCFFPCVATAATLFDCDKASYDIVVRNAGAERTVTLTPTNGFIEEYGPMVSFAIKGKPPVVVQEPQEEYCIWSGKITIQRRNTYGVGGTGNVSLR